MAAGLAMLGSSGGDWSRNGGGGPKWGTLLGEPARLVGIGDEGDKLSSATVVVAVDELLESALASEHACEFPQEYEITHELVPLWEWPVVKTVR